MEAWPKPFFLRFIDCTVDHVSPRERRILGGGKVIFFVSAVGPLVMPSTHDGASERGHTRNPNGVCTAHVRETRYGVFVRNGGIVVIYITMVESSETAVTDLKARDLTGTLVRKDFESTLCTFLAVSHGRRHRCHSFAGHGWNLY